MPSYSQLSDQVELSSPIIPPDPQLHIEPVREFNEGMPYSENPSGSDGMLKAQRRLSFECIDGSVDPPEDIFPRVLHREDKKLADDEPHSVQCVSKNVMISEKMLDVEKDFMLEENIEVYFSNYVEQAGVNLPRRDAMSYKVVPNKQKHQHGEITSDHSIDMFADSHNQSREAVICSQNENSRCRGISSQQIVHEPLSKLQVSYRSQKNTATFVKPMRKLMLSDFKASKEKHGMLRRCFQFGNDLNKSKRLISNAPGSNLQQVPIQIAVPAKLNPDSHQSTRTSFSSYAGMIPAVNIFRRTGIGLHLNSIVRPVLTAPPPSHTKMHDSSIKPMKLANIKQPHVVQKETKLFKGVNPEQNINMTHGKEGSAGGTMYKHLSSYGANRILLNTGNKIGSHPDKRKSRSEQHDLFDELNESRPKRKRKRTGSVSTEGCRRCYCKMTGCLKLYCDCFAAGFYCAETCSCQGCSNKPKFQDIVRETMAHLGCSKGCCCEGCKNIYGKNTGYDDLQKTFLSRTIQRYDNNLMANRKKTIISRTDFSNLQYHEFVTPSLDPPRKREFSPSDHLSIESLSFPDANSNSSGLANQQPGYDANKYSHSRSNSLGAKGVDFSAASGTRVQFSPDCRFPFVGPPLTHGLSNQKNSHPENDYGYNLSDIKEDETGTSDHSTPVNSVSVRSPNRRRFCHRRPLALHNLGTGSSYTLTSARKFILKSMPTLQSPAIDNSQKKNSDPDS